MKTILALTLVLLTNAAFQCGTGPLPIPEESDYCSNIDWLRAIIDSADQGSNHTEVIRYEYKGETVYYMIRVWVAPIAWRKYTVVQEK